MLMRQSLLFYTKVCNIVAEVIITIQYKLWKQCCFVNHDILISGIKRNVEYNFKCYNMNNI